LMVINVSAIYIYLMAKVTIDQDALVLAVATKQPGFRWPIPVDARLDGLVSAANAAGAATSRKELLAALVVGAAARPASLLEAVVKLRVTTVRETALRGTPQGGYNLRKPGRPRRAGG
jgi:hypothetical protein